MGRFDTLNAETQDLINCLLPALAASFGVSDAVNIIPEDIRMRAWDCDRRDHVKGKTENDPRNWGVQFLKDLMAISRIKKGDLNAFVTDLRVKVGNHEAKHPWCRLADIRELKDEYENPNRQQEVVDESAGTSSTDSYLEELHEPDLPKGTKRNRHEVYEARVQESHKSRKYGNGRLRRADDGGYLRKEKSKGRSKSRHSAESGSSSNNCNPMRRPSRTIQSDGESSANETALFAHPTPSFSMSPVPLQAPSISDIAKAVARSDEPLAVQKLQAELEVAEAELKAARLKYEYIQAKEQAENQTK
ncbi:hypothetical protein GQ44DRAFT_771523 [Phaeosphaeriaceae sp. PMI808]|nr:hypothetical protein GQ44DRAFT_771523 [Phaeosphaeriaceae sp. PMI808]